jgi:hypothetical protein
MPLAGGIDRGKIRGNPNTQILWIQIPIQPSIQMPILDQESAPESVF